MVRGLLKKIASKSLSVAGKWQQHQLRRLNIHEYQGAELMANHGINVPPGIAVSSVEKIRKPIQDVFPKENEARQALQALRGIIRLQAVARGNLVRRQAIATLQSVRGIVKIQALVRGQRVRHSDIGREVHKRWSLGELDGICLGSCKNNGSKRAEKLLRTAFVCKSQKRRPSLKHYPRPWNCYRGILHRLVNTIMVAFLMSFWPFSSLIDIHLQRELANSVSESRKCACVRVPIYVN